MTQDTFVTNADSQKLKSELEKYQLGFTMAGMLLHITSNALHKLGPQV